MFDIFGFIRSSAGRPAVFALLAVPLAGCAIAPGQGPSTSDIVAATSAAPVDQRDGYLITTLDQRVIDLVGRRSRESLRGRFGDYRGAVNPTIGVGDTLQVTIWEAAAGGLFSSPVIDRASPGSHTASIPEQQVARDGSITVPYAGRIAVAGMTTAKIESTIVAALQGKAIDPQVLVTIARNVSNTATVSGEVAQGARVPLSPRGDRILEVIATAGGIKAPVHETFITLTRNGNSVTVPMQALLANPEENVFVRPGDALTLVRVPQSFTAFGATGRNAMVPFEAQGITLEEAVAKAGGLLDHQSDPSGVFVFRREPVAVARALNPTFVIPADATAVNVIYRLDLRDAKSYFLARQFAVENKDMIYVASAPLNDLQKFLSILNMAVSPAYAAKVLAD
jgi:polysaccharide export outer membrane protein